MAKPPPTPPSSDIEGVDQDRKPAGHPPGRSAEDEADAARESKGRPADTKR